MMSRLYLPLTAFKNPPHIGRVSLVVIRCEACGYKLRDYPAAVNTDLPKRCSVCGAVGSWKQYKEVKHNAFSSK